MESEMESVDDMFIWKNNSSRESVEKVNKETTKLLGWEFTDVLYSFLGVYVLGAFCYYPEKFHLEGNIIKTYEKSNNRYTNAWSLKYLTQNYKSLKYLNNNCKLEEYIKLSFSIGNVCPIWPGGNSHKGQSCCYDLPDVYFNRHFTII